MTFGHDRIINSYGEPVQQSMTVNSRDTVMLNTYKLMLGVVLEVHASDTNENRSAYQREDRRGYLHTATVLVLEDGRGTYLTLDNVIITPDTISGIDDYYERLPKGCSAQINGQNFNSQLNHIDPYTLDGDWCVVGFLGGSMDQPFILRWWPHSRNVFDPATSGKRNPNNADSQPYLDQAGRMFQRINGVEFVVTKQGDLYLSTHRSNSRLNYGEPVSQDQGRFPRTLDENDGGSIKAWIKKSQSLELDWNPPVDGLGILDSRDAQVPQTNPRGGSSARQDKDSTYVLFDKDRTSVSSPEEIHASSRSILLEGEEETTIKTRTLQVEATDVSVESTNVSVEATGSLDVDVSTTTNITGTGPVTIQANSTLDLNVTGVTNIVAGGTLALAGASVSIGAGGASGGAGSITATTGTLTLGSGSLGGVVGGNPLTAAVNAYQAAVAAAAASATVDVAAWQALSTATQAFAAAVAAAVSSTTTVG